MGFEELRVTRGRRTTLAEASLFHPHSRIWPRAPSLLTVDITDAFGTAIMQADPSSTPFVPGTPGDYEFSMEIFLPALIPGTYWLSFRMGPNNGRPMILFRMPWPSRLTRVRYRDAHFRIRSTMATS